MKKLILIVLGFALLCVAAASVPQNALQVFTLGVGSGYPSNTSGGTVLTGVGWGSKNLATRSVVRIDSSTAGIVRFLPLSSTSKATRISVRVLADTPVFYGVPAATPFFNLSGVTGTFLVM